MSKTGYHVRSKRVGQVDKALWFCGNCRFFIPPTQAEITGRCTQGHGRKYGEDGTDCPDLELSEPESDLNPRAVDMTVEQQRPGNERQPTIPAEMTKYADCMEEIKKRTEVVDGFLRRKWHAKYLQTTVESICLQIRKILELIALASLAANKAEYEKQKKNFHFDWRAKQIFKTLDKANPQFYPSPSKQVISPETGEVVGVKPITSGYLSRTDYEALYDECSEILHASNPFSGEQQKTQAFLDKTPEWMEKIRALLNHHQMQLIDERVQLWVIMQGKSDGKVQVIEFGRVYET